MKVVYILLLMCLSLLGRSQVGVYRTYEDFVEGNVEEYAEYVSTVHAGPRFWVVFKDESGEKHKLILKKENMWGFKRRELEVLRVDERGIPNVILTYGKLIIYGNYSTRIDDSGFAEMRVSQYGMRISKGYNGKMLTITRREIRTILADEEAAMTSLLEARSMGIQAVIDWVRDYNKKHEHATEERKISIP